MGRSSLNSRGGHAGPNGDLAVIRRWIAPRGGRLAISGSVSSQLNSTQPLDFVVDARGRDQHGNFAWSPVLRMEAATADKSENTIWDAAKDFPTKAPVITSPTFDVWERYAQVLLEANEFLFLD